MITEYWLTTHSGKKFVLTDLDIDQIDIEDIAHSLSTMYRFNGHTKYPYSVAQHCIAVAKMIATKHSLLPSKYALTGLLHDAAEAYIGDIIYPVKALNPILQMQEDAILQLIMEKFGGIFPLPQCIKAIDDRMGITEQQQLLSIYNPHRKDIQPLNIKIHDYEAWMSVKMQYLSIFNNIDQLYTLDFPFQFK